ncbi:MAG TPA: hypothetical protein VGZ01_07825, partial [Trinickia sp.]|nr:hypothetical protein [Trinickia sp.]
MSRKQDQCLDLVRKEQNQDQHVDLGGSMFEISEHEIVGRLKFDNPWWESFRLGVVPYAGMQRRKYFESFFRAVSDRSIRRAVVLMGPRRVGKTVMIYHAIEALLKSGV